MSSTTTKSSGAVVLVLPTGPKAGEEGGVATLVVHELGGVVQ